MRGKITGPEYRRRGADSPLEAWPAARKTLQQKYWLTRISALWSKKTFTWRSKFPIEHRYRRVLNGL